MGEPIYDQQDADNYHLAVENRALRAERDTLKAAIEKSLLGAIDNEIIRAVAALRQQQTVAREQAGQTVFVSGTEAAREYLIEAIRAALAACVPPPQKRDNGKHNTPHDFTRDPETQMCVICGWAEQAHNFACVPPQSNSDRP